MHNKGPDETVWTVGRRPMAKKVRRRLGHRHILVCLPLAWQQVRAVSVVADRAIAGHIDRGHNPTKSERSPCDLWPYEPVHFGTAEEGRKRMCFEKADFKGSSSLIVQLVQLQGYRENSTSAAVCKLFESPFKPPHQYIEHALFNFSAIVFSQKYSSTLVEHKRKGEYLNVK